MFVSYLFSEFLFFKKESGFIVLRGQSNNHLQSEFPESCLKLDDFYFINENTGWVIRGIDLVKIIYKSSNGCNNWFVVFENNHNVFRSILFKNSLNGFIGTLDKDVLLGTSVIAGYYEELAIVFLNENSGIVGGLRYLDTGKVEGESYFTSDSGNSWISDSSYQNLNRIKLINNKIFASGKSFL